MGSPVDHPNSKGSFINLPVNTDARVGIEADFISTSKQLKYYSPYK